MERTGIILGNTGTPDAPEAGAVGQYLERFLTDERIAPRIPKALWRLIVTKCIIPKRSVASAAKYRLIWQEAGSPLRCHMEALATKLNELFQSTGDDIHVAAGMSYGTPSMQDAFAKLMSAGCESFAILPLYPQSAHSTTGSATDAALRAHEPASQSSLKILPSYYADPMYIQSLAKRVQDAGFNPEAGDHLFMSFHSIPLADIKCGDTYAEEVQKTCSLLAKELQLADGAWSMGFQCRFDKARSWLSPFTKDQLARLGAQGITGRLFFICPNFAIDCLETLYDVPYELAPIYLEASGRAEDSFVYIPCLNSTYSHVQTLANVIRRAL